MSKPLGQQAVLNGKPVRWAGNDYGWQSPGSYSQLEQSGQLALGSSIVRRLGQGMNQLDQVRDSIFGTDQRLVQAANRADQFISQNTVVGLADQGAGIAGSSIAQRLGINPLLGAMLLGSLVPGQGDGVPSRPIQRRLGTQASTPPGYLSPEAAAAAQARGRANARQPVRQNTAPPGSVNMFDGNNYFVNVGTTDKPIWQLSTKSDPVGPEYRFDQGRYNSGQDAVVERLSIANPPKPSQGRVPDNRPPSVMPGGAPGKRPQSQAQYDQPGQPSSSRGTGPNPEREFRPDIISRKEVEFEDLDPSDMAKLQGDGNSYEGLNQPVPIPAKERNRQRRSGEEARLLNDKEKLIAERLKKLDPEAKREAVFWADGDYDKLAEIAEELGIPVEKYKHASRLEDAINNKLSSLEVTYSGKPTITKGERAAIVQNDQLKNDTGRTQAEQLRMAAAATRRFGTGRPGRQPIKPVDNGSKPASTNPEIDARIRARTEANLRPSRSRSQNRSSNEHRYISDAERAMLERMQRGNRDFAAEVKADDAELTGNAVRSMSPRAQAAAERRRRRKPKALRSIQDRLNQD